MNASYTRLDTLETVNISSPEISSRVLYGIAYPADIVRTSALSPTANNALDRGCPYLRLTPSAKWAVRLVPVIDLSNSTRAAQIAYLSRRDGWSCFYCDRTLDSSIATIEHIVCTAHGGPTHADNLCLAHESCNAAAGSLSGYEKVKLAIGVRVGTIAASVFKDQQRRKDVTGKRGAK